MTLVILGSGFDADLGLRNSFSEFSKDRLNPVCGVKSWSDFEGSLRMQIINWYNDGMDDQLAKEINLLWQSYRKNLSFFFTEKSDEFLVDETRCAYKFLKSFSKNTKIYTFNYTDPYDYVNVESRKEITHIHGLYHRDTFGKDDLMVMSQGHNMILGIDSDCIPHEAMENKYISPIVKRHQKGYSMTNIIHDLSNSENVIFFGFSMNEVDYIYFKQFFTEIENCKSKCRKIVYFTLNEIEYDRFRNNLRKNGVNFDQLINNVSIQPYYTEQGSQTEKFYEILQSL